MSYKEWIDTNGSLHKEWTNEAGQLHRDSGPAKISYYPDGFRWEYFCKDGKLHRDSGPAKISYYPDGSIEWDSFFVAGKFLGDNKEGFWALWEILSEEGRRAPNLLKYLAGFVNYSCSSYVEIKK